MHREGLTKRFGMEPPRLARLLRALEAGYSPSNPYHNSAHAADVLRNLHVLLHGARLTEHYLDPLGLLAAYFAAIVHDYGHHGLTNDFLVATSHPLALRYNDRCPLESHHCAAAFSLIAERPDLDALAGLSRAQRAAFRKQVGCCGAPDVEAPAAPEAPVPRDDAERLLSLQVALKVADLGHLGAELEAHKRWLRCLEEEFFGQGDRERQLGLPISPLFDRSKQGVSKSQARLGLG
ncbi:hypothetical protein GPECTOR_18g155 [Gonium pectorale]|uniref:PDEase domain-containing protein n=1 Tax=Gonium pectorale TaxID=33097 RepID=A0A150GKY1_GONPE|nr:hypothetical protein GPECTOR_18g155 [Gonium pectorale]|eukprot:KXZ50000.1 hypothetical protein GPECTOR_18g155 [Gonium pectorale]